MICITFEERSRTSRRAQKLDPHSFFRWLFPGFDKYLSFERWLDTRTIPFPGDPERIGDTVAELTAKGELAPPWAIPVEFQIEPDPDMFGRLTGFISSLWLHSRPDQSRASRYQVAAVVVNLTGTSSSAPASRNYVLPGPYDVGCALKVREVYLQTESASALIQRIRSGELSRALLVWIPLMQTDDISGIIAQWVELATSEPDEKLRAELGALTKVFARLSSGKDQWLQALEGWNVITSPFLDEIRAESRTEDILQTLQLRFKVNPSSEVVSRLRQTRDLARLSKWFQASVTANSYEEFLAMFGQD
jgi:hypothetical protein